MSALAHVPIQRRYHKREALAVTIPACSHRKQLGRSIPGIKSFFKESKLTPCELEVGLIFHDYSTHDRGYSFQKNISFVKAMW